MSEKLKSVQELKSIVTAARSSGKTVVLTNGCFDLLHRGHVHTLRRAKACGDILVVAVNSDQSVREIKGPTRPILPEGDRIELIGAMEMVDYVTLFDEPDPYEVIAELKPDILAKGGDWTPNKIIGSDIVEQNGGKMVIIPYLEGFSTTEIIASIRR